MSTAQLYTGETLLASERRPWTGELFWLVAITLHNPRFSTTPSPAALLLEEEPAPRLERRVPLFNLRLVFRTCIKTP